MPTETPAPPTGPEVRLSGKPRSGDRPSLPNSVLTAINAEAAKNAPQALSTPELDPNPPKPPATPPEAKPAQIEPVKPPTPPVPPAKETPRSDKEENLANLRKKAEDLETRLTTAVNSGTATAKEKADLAVKFAEAEGRANKLAEEIDKTYRPQTERLKVVEQELQKREEILRIKDYTATDEFHTKFVKPLADAQTEVTELLSELVVPSEDGQTSRQATMDDFNAVLAAPSLNKAAEIAQAKFGPLIAQSVVNMRTRIRGLQRTREEAVKNAGLASAEYVKNQQSQQAQFQENMRNAVRAEANRLMAESPEFNPADDDNESKAVIAAATEFADKLIEGDPTWAPEQWAKNVAKARVKLIGHDVVKKQRDAYKARVTELEEKLKAYENSEPQLRPRGGGGATVVPVNGDKPERAKLHAAINDLVAQRQG